MMNASSGLRIESSLSPPVLGAIIACIAIILGIPMLCLLQPVLACITQTTLRALRCIPGIRPQFQHMEVLMVEGGLPILFHIAEIIPRHASTSVQPAVSVSTNIHTVV